MCCLRDCISVIVRSDLLESQSGNLFAWLSPRAAPGWVRVEGNGAVLLLVSFLITFWQQSPFLRVYCSSGYCKEQAIFNSTSADGVFLKLCWFFSHGDAFLGAQTACPCLPIIQNIAFYFFFGLRRTSSLHSWTSRAVTMKELWVFVTIFCF